MAANRFGTRFNVRNDVFDSITPNFIRQKDISAPNGEWKPAKWLPVQWTASNLQAGEDAFVISGGKVVALDRTGAVIPAGYFYFCALVAATSETFVTYTADDYNWGVTDITTGDRYAVNGTTAYTATQVATALLERGLVTEAQATIAAADASLSGYSATDMPTRGGTMTIDENKAVFNAFISKPVGIAAYDVFVYSGQPIDGDQWFTNYSKQQLIQFITEAQLIVPHRAADSTSSDAFNAGTIVKVTASATAGDFPRPGEVWSGAALASVTRYSALGVTSTSGHVALALAQDDVAANTTRTPIECDVDGVLTTQKTSITAVSSEGDWYLDADVGVIIVHEDTYATLVSGSTTATFSYFFYAQPGSVTDVATAHRYIHFDGLAVCGDKLGVDKQSNFVKSNATSDVLDGASPLGTVLYCLSEPRTQLERVKTAYNLSNMSASSKMPGTATAGYSDSITLSQEDVSDRLAILLVRI
jgi:hypothetical protein